MIRLLMAFTLVLAMPLMAAKGGSGVKEPPKGFVSLFNGKDLSGWKDAEKQGDSWKVEDGCIMYLGKGGKNLATDKNYKDFELLVDWKILPKGDSGLYIRGMPQVQIWDNPEGSGGLYNNPKDAPGRVPLVVADNPVGEWNTFYIQMVGDKMSVKLNDKLVVDNATFLPLKKECPPEGTIELQVHGNTLYFRNLFVRELPAKE